MALIKRLCVVLLVAVVFGAVQPAAAHGYIVRAIPENRASLDRAPTRLQYWFSEALEYEFSTINVRNQDGEIIATGGVDEENNTLMSVRLSPDLPDGAYIVELRPAFASDGHVIAESRVFFVGDEVGNVSGQAASDQAVPLEVVWRVLVLSATILLFGMFTLYGSVLLPAWGSDKHRAGGLPPRVMSRLNWIVAAGLVLAFGGNILALIQQTMVFFNVGIDKVFSGNLWAVVRIGSRFGDVWNIRMLFLVVVAGLHVASIYYRKNHPESVRAFWAANVWMMALIIGSLSVTSHAAGALLWPWLAMAVDWLHGAAVAFWVGGLAALVLVLPVALRPYDRETRTVALQAVMRRFSRLVTVAVVIVVATGVYSAFTQLYTPADLAQTTYGNALLLKLLLVGLLLGVAALHHLALRPGLAERWQRRLPGLSTFISRAGRFAATLRLEVVLVLVVLVSVGLLSATPVPEPSFINEGVETPSAEQTVNGLNIALTITPGGPGVNTYDTVITRGDDPVEGLDVYLQMVSPPRARRSDWGPVEAVDSGLYVTANDRIDQAGQWWTVLDVVRDDGSTTRAVFEWTISNEAAVIDTREPGPLHLVALAGVVLALGWALYPSARRFYDKLDLNPFNVVVAISAVILTILFLGVAIVVLQEQQRQYWRTLNPPPEVVNTVPPDETSLARGKRLFNDYCAAWRDDRSFDALQDRLAVTRDDELFMATREGWRGLPACEGDLDEEQRWHIVNYIRTFGSRG